MTVAERIREGLGKCSPAERRVGRLLLSDYPAAGLDTVARLAERAETSGPTVLRFLSRLGFDGFGDLQESLRGEIAERTASPLTLLGSEPVASPDDTPLGRAQSILPAATARTLELLPPDELHAAVALLRTGATASTRTVAASLGCWRSTSCCTSCRSAETPGCFPPNP